MIETDVLVVGGGPAGSAAAARAARLGLDVTLIDRASFPRDKCCGDGLTTLALRLLAELGFDRDAVPNWFDVHDIVLRSPAGHVADLTLPHDDGAFAAVAPRVELDAALLDLARDAGAHVHTGHAFAGFLPADDDGRIRVDVQGSGAVACRHLVAADGMWSPVRKAMGLNQPGYLGEWHAFRQYVTNVTGPAADRLYVWFDTDLVPGYAWSFPLPGGRANVGFGLLRDGGDSMQRMRGMWDGLFDRPHIRDALGAGATPEGRHSAWPIPARVDQATLAVGQVLFAGDAAMATDQLTGEGIGQALLTGMQAADAIAATRYEPADAAGARYRRAVRRHLLADHRMSVALTRLTAHGRAVDAGVRLVNASAWTRRSFARWMFEDEPRAAAFTPRRWHRQFLRRPGADLPRSAAR